MGVFDTVWIECKECNKLIEYQTRQGPCALKDYYLKDGKQDTDVIPEEILSGITTEKRIYCEHCGAEFSPFLSVEFKPQYTFFLVGE